MPNLTERTAGRILAQTVDLLRVSEGMRRTILRDLRRLEADLVRDLITQAGRSELTKERLRMLLTETRATIDTAYGKIAERNTAELQKVAVSVGRQTARGVNAAVRIDLMSVALSQEQIEFIAGKTVVNGRFPHEWWKKQSPALRDRFAEQMRQGQYRGEGVDDLVRRVRGTKASGFTDGVMQASRRQAETLVRTSVISVANEAKLQSYVNNRDVIKGIQWVATLEGACEECAALNGKVWTLPGGGDKDADYEPDGHSMSFPGSTEHWNCRCTQVPVTYSFDELRERES